MRLNKDQKKILKQSLAKEYKEVQTSLFSMGMYNRADKTGSFNKRWQELIKKKNDIIAMVDMCKDETLEEVYFNPVVKELNKEYEEMCKR